MATKLKFNPITARFDLVEHIPELATDPSSPNAEDAWVLRSGSAGGVTGGGVIQAFLGLGFPVLTAGTGGASSYTYELSYRTQDGTTKRVALT